MLGDNEKFSLFVGALGVIVREERDTCLNEHVMEWMAVGATIEEVLKYNEQRYLNELHAEMYFLEMGTII